MADACPELAEAFSTAVLEAARGRPWRQHVDGLRLPGTVAMRRPERATVIGIRTIGTTLSAVVAARLEARGCAVVRRFTVRPEGHPYHRWVRLQEGFQAAGAGWCVVVDEGPGRSGSSFAAVGRVLEEAGVAAERIVLVPANGPEPEALCSEEGRAAWRRYGKYQAMYQRPAYLEGAAELGLGSRLQYVWSEGPVRRVAKIYGVRRCWSCWGRPGACRWRRAWRASRRREGICWISSAGYPRRSWRSGWCMPSGASRLCRRICSVDPELYYPEPGVAVKWDLGYLGTYSEDRQAGLERLLLEPAREWGEGRFVVAGPQYPPEVAWPENVERVEHLAAGGHRAFYNGQRYTLNVTRADMVAAGWSPSVRLFEAAACGTPLVSDGWAGLETLFRPGEEILLANSSEVALRILRESKESRRRQLAERARERVLGCHTGYARALELESHVAETAPVLFSFSST